MLLLTSTSDKLQLVTTAAVATHIHADWMDIDGAGAVTPGRLNTIVSTATTSDIVASPTGGTQRNIKNLTVRAVGGQQVITVQHTDGATVVEVFDVTLQPGEVLVFTEGAGFQVFNSLGSQKMGSGVSGAFTVVNVRDYGALGDGTTNDLAAIQAAISAAGAMGVGARGVDVFFPAGVYSVNGTITCNFNNVMLLGAGWQSTVIQCSVTTGDVIQFGNGAGSFAGCGLSNMSVTKSATGTTGANININKMNDVRIQNFDITNPFIGILVQGASARVFIDEGEINDVAVTTGHGIQVINGTARDTYIRQVIITNNPANKPATGINLQQTGHVQIISCSVNACLKGLLVNPTGTQLVTYVFIEHSLFDSCSTHGAHFTPSGAATAKIQSVMAVDSWFSGTTAAGSGIEFTIANSAVNDGFSFIGCRILNNWNAGVTIGAGPTNISFTDCTLAGNGQQTINTYNAVEIAAAASGILFEGCKIGQCGTATNQHKYAVNIAAGAGANLCIVNNDCQPNGTLGNMGYIQAGAVTGGGSYFENNTPIVADAFSTARIAATSAFTTSETLVSDATAIRNRLMANGIRAGTTLRFTIQGACTVTTGASTWTCTVRLGTNNSTSDAAILATGSITSGGVGAAPFKIVIEVTCRTTGGSGTFFGYFAVLNDSATLGILPRNAGVLLGTASAANTATAHYVNVSMLGSTNVSFTVQTCTAEVVAT